MLSGMAVSELFLFFFFASFLSIIMINIEFVFCLHFVILFSPVVFIIYIKCVKAEGTYMPSIIYYLLLYALIFNAKLVPFIIYLILPGTMTS